MTAVVPVGKEGELLVGITNKGISCISVIASFVFHYLNFLDLGR